MEKAVAGLMFLSVLTLTRAVVPGSATGNEINQLNKKQTTGIGGTLYPQATETRDLRTLDGVWNFRKSPVDPEFGYKHGWYEKDLEKVYFLIFIRIFIYLITDSYLHLVVNNRVGI